MSDHQPEKDSNAQQVRVPHDSEAALQKELRREAAEGDRVVGDMASNRNLSGAASWETLPESTTSDASRRTAAGDETRQHVADEIAARLRRDGVRLHGSESGEDLVRLLEVVERFETAVRRRGGDLMVDEPVGDAAPIAPDNRAFVLPVRRDDESIASYVERIAAAIPS